LARRSGKGLKKDWSKPGEGARARRTPGHQKIELRLLDAQSLDELFA
jgi:hypothetical protein